ncbi:MAG: PKD domain-containing protein [Bacteroidetes bacterium]|nr:PKD domain-containing protein [Bacteroidota bacterium]
MLDPVINFINQSTFASSYLWNFGDGTITSITAPFHEYTTPGSFAVTLIAGNNYNCNDTAIRTIKIYTLFKFYIPNAFTPGGKTRFLSLRWNFRSG